MAAQQPFHGQPATLPRAMLLDGLQAIGTAGGREAATGPDHRGDEAPIEGDASQKNSSESLIHRPSQVVGESAR